MPGKTASVTDKHTLINTHTHTRVGSPSHTLPHAHVHMGTCRAELAPFALGSEMTPVVKPGKGLLRAEAKDPERRLAGIHL